VERHQIQPSRIYCCGCIDFDTLIRKVQSPRLKAADIGGLSRELLDPNYVPNLEVHLKIVKSTSTHFKRNSALLELNALLFI
jgi:hypothetical protein